MDYINYISKPVDEWTDDTARLAMLLATRKDIYSYNETGKLNIRESEDTNYVDARRRDYRS